MEQMEHVNRPPMDGPRGRDAEIEAGDATLLVGCIHPDTADYKYIRDGLAYHRLEGVSERTAFPFCPDVPLAGDDEDARQEAEWRTREWVLIRADGSRTVTTYQGYFADYDPEGREVVSTFPPF